MKAARYYGPGDVRIEQVPDPHPPGKGEVMLQIHMGSLCGTDVSQFKQATLVPLTEAHPVSGHVGPVILGHEVVGTVVEKGPDVVDLALGDRVVPGAGMWCGTCPRCQEGRSNICERSYLLGIHADGGLAQLAKFPAKMCIPVPAACSDEAAAIAQPCAVALHALRRAGISSGQTIALFGIGGIGSLLLAALLMQERACRIVAIDVDPARLATAAALGAIAQIDARMSDVVRAVGHWTSGRGVDVAIEASGLPETMGQALSVVRKGGKLLQIGIPSRPVPLIMEEAVVGEKEIVTTNGQICGVDLPAALHLLTTTDLLARVGFCVIALERLVDDGLVPLVEQRAGGKVIVTIV
jgi:(R,R)-butanediol dehydrogenase/meso-butanediol dehydrogenase/diacetyl reductase